MIQGRQIYQAGLIILCHMDRKALVGLPFLHFHRLFHFTNDEIEGQRGLFPNRSDTEYKILMETVNDFLYKHRRKYLKEASDNYIAKLVDERIYPEFDTQNVMGIFQKRELDNLVGTLYAAQPKIFTGLSDDNKKITLQLLKLIMDNF